MTISAWMLEGSLSLVTFNSCILNMKSRVKDKSSKSSFSYDPGTQSSAVSRIFSSPSSWGPSTNALRMFTFT